MSTSDIRAFLADKNVIVVGNNATALTKEQGQFIDSYDIVVRFGKGIPDGNEKYLGRRTDIWVTGGFRRDMRNCFPETTRVLYNTSTLGNVTLPLPDYEHTVMYSPQEIKNLGEKYETGFKRLSAGAVAGLWLTNEANTYKSITFINFDFFTQTVKFHDENHGQTNVASSWHLPLAYVERINLEDPSDHPAHSIEAERQVFAGIFAQDNAHFIGSALTAVPQFIDVERMSWDHVRKRIQTTES